MSRPAQFFGSFLIYCSHAEDVGINVAQLEVHNLDRCCLMLYAHTPPPLR